MTKTNIHTTTGDSLHLVKDYDHKIQYRTFRGTCTLADTPESIRKEYGIDKDWAVTATVRFDDDDENGHCTLSVTGSSLLGETRTRSNPEPGVSGCIHDLIRCALPALSRAIAFHLTSTDEPMHYLANAVYLAGDTDYNGRRKGDPSAWEYGIRFGNSPVAHTLRPAFYKWLKERHANNLLSDFHINSIAHDDRAGETFKYDPHWTLTGYAEKWHECPFNNETQAREFCNALNMCAVEFVQIVTKYADGKARELNSARSVAIWPDATDEELSAPSDELRAKLTARLPGLMAEFRSIVESLGFDYDFPAKARGAK